MSNMHETYLPFTKDDLKIHFQNDEHLESYSKSAKAYTEFESSRDSSKIYNIKEMKHSCQIEKDETIWTASCFTTMCLRSSKKDDLKNLLIKAFGETPPLKNLHTWDECLSPDYEVFFEIQIPSPRSYKEYVKNYVVPDLLIKYVRDSADSKVNLEGSTHVDAVIINKHNGFSVFVEAKVLSDISYQVTYDEKRNQIIRNLDVMLESNHELQEPLNNRKPENTLFLLLTPRKFKDAKIKSRLYAYKYEEYKSNPEKIQEEMPHSPNLDYGELSKRIGWITWEDFHDISNDYCRWL